MPDPPTLPSNGDQTERDPQKYDAARHMRLEQQWICEQESLKTKLILKDDFHWSIKTSTEITGSSPLRFVGGVDVSFSKVDPSMACAALVVLDLHQNLNVVYEDYNPVHLQIPYIPGFLAFREAPPIITLLQNMKNCCHPFYPQLLMVDGNGLIHPRGFGLACHLGVLAELPTIGIGKNLHHVGGLTRIDVKHLLEDKTIGKKDMVILTGDTGLTLGVAMRSKICSSKPIFVSIGHRISLDSCVKIVKVCCRFRIPEPIRQADIKSREWFHINEASPM